MVSDKATIDKESNTVSTASTTKLVYYGGPVIKNINIIPVFWTDQAYQNMQSSMKAFYGALVTGNYMNFFSEYNTASPAQTIGKGSVGNIYVDTAATTSGTVYDSDIQNELKRLFLISAISQPNGNNFYAVHFPASVTVDDGSGSKSCVVFCAYHSSFTYNGNLAYYSVMPDFGSGSGCSSGCGSSTMFNNICSVASHEVAEAITDANVGAATTVGYPLAWYDSKKGEVGDMCSGQASIVLGDGKTYTVQTLWSNKANACVSPPSGAATGPTLRPTQFPSSPTKTPAKLPTKVPTRIPTKYPSSPTKVPTKSPTTLPAPTAAPTRLPSKAPSSCSGVSQYIGDGWCDELTSPYTYNTAECNWDGGDCCPGTCTAGRTFPCGVYASYKCRDPSQLSPTSYPSSKPVIVPLAPV